MSSEEKGDTGYLDSRHVGVFSLCVFDDDERVTDENDCILLPVPVTLCLDGVRVHNEDFDNLYIWLVICNTLQSIK